MFVTEINSQSIRLVKFGRRTDELEQRRYVDMESITPLSFMEDCLDSDQVHSSIPAFINEGSLICGDIVKGFDRYLWIEKELLIPPQQEGFDIVGIFHIK